MDGVPKVAVELTALRQREAGEYSSNLQMLLLDLRKPPMTSSSDSAQAMIEQTLAAAFEIMASAKTQRLRIASP